MRCFTELDTELVLRDFKNCVRDLNNLKDRKMKNLGRYMGGTDRGIW